MLNRILAPVLLLGLTACGSGGGDVGTLVLNNGAEPGTLDPGIQQGSPEHHINIGLFEGLTVYDPKTLVPRPGIAESWETSPDGLTWTFRLRENARWSNGDPVTAHDFEWAWKRVLDPRLASQYVEIISNFLKNAHAFYAGATADGTLAGWASMSPEERAKAASALPAQAQKRHADALKPLLAGAAADLRPSLEAALAESQKRVDVGRDDVGVKAKDDRTLVVVLEAPTPFFLDLTSFFTYYPVHRKTVEADARGWWTKPESFVGNGPYRMKEWRVKEHILIEKSPTYWDAANVPGERIKFLPIENQSTAFNLYEQGKIHWMTTVPLDYIEELMKRPDFHSGPFLTTYFYGINTTKGPFKDKRVRQALARALDLEKITKHVTRAGEIPARSLVPPGLPGYAPAQMAPYDPEAAKKLLAEAGYPEGKGFPKMTLLYNTLEAHKKIASAVQEMWRNTLGVEIELANLEWKVYLDRQNRMQFDVIRRAWIGDYGDPTTFLDMFMTNNGHNNTGWSNAEYDRLLRDARYERDAQKRVELLRKAEVILMDELPILPIYFYVTKNMWKPEVQGLYDNVRDTHPFQRVRLGGAQP